MAILARSESATKWDNLRERGTAAPETATGACVRPGRILRLFDFLAVFIRSRRPFEYQR
jgi:hypothetical protein